MIEIYQLRQLIAISECGSLSKAAEQLQLSQPALSRTMKRLAKDYIGSEKKGMRKIVNEFHNSETV